MINTLITSFKIDMTYSINSFIYNIKRIPILGVFLPNDMYQKNNLKRIIQCLIFIYRLFKNLLFKFTYFLFIYFISSLFNDISNSFIYTFVIFTLIGIITSSKLLDVNSRNYFSVILFNIDAKKYVMFNLFLRLFNTVIFNLIFLIGFSIIIDINFLSIIFLIIFSSFSRLICEAIHLKYYEKYNKLLLSNNIYLLVILGLLCSFILPCFSIYISQFILFIITIISIILGFISYRYLYSFSDYKLIYKRLNTERTVMVNSDEIAYSKQSYIEIKDRDKFINKKKILGKKGYDLFNTIFFERHKQILLRSSRIYAVIISVIIIIFSIILVVFPEFKSYINEILHTRLAIFVFIMYFINRGMVVTKAMFFNCDHAMLTFNFYRDPKVVLSLFKKRLFTIIKINLIPSLVIAIGLVLLLFISGGSESINYIMIFLFIIILSIFFSVHYLMLYYLLQPFTKDLKINDFRYSLASFFTYFIAYNIMDIKLSSVVFCFVGIVFTLLYIIISLIVVYKVAYRTFRLK